MYRRPVFKTIINRINEKRRFIQVLAGPRQTGKTTLARQLIDALKIPCHYASADEPLLKNSSWIDQQWETARINLKTTGKKSLLILDEIQKVPNWSASIKQLWDEDSINKPLLKPKKASK